MSVLETFLIKMHLNPFFDQHSPLVKINQNPYKIIFEYLRFLFPVSFWRDPCYCMIICNSTSANLTAKAQIYETKAYKRTKSININL